MADGSETTPGRSVGCARFWKTDPVIGAGTHGIGNWVAAVFSWLLGVGILVVGVQTMNGRWAQWTVRDYVWSPRWRPLMRILCGGMLTGLGVVIVVAIPIILVAK